LLSLITVLQSNSPICDKRSPSHIAGAEPGNFWFRNDLIPILDGLTGFICTPCGLVHEWLEWGPTLGSGLFGRHLQPPADVISRKNEDGRMVMVRRDSGNALQDVREFLVLVNGKPYIFSMHGTAHTVARQWVSFMDQVRHPQTNKPMPVCSQRYLVTTIARSSAKGSWFVPKVEFRGFVASRAEYDTAKEFAEIVKRGTYRIDMSGAEMT
jgi:hypothetical protein